MGEAATVGSARFNAPDGTAAILLHSELPVEEQAEALLLLLRDDETPVFITTVPARRKPVESSVWMAAG